MFLREAGPFNNLFQRTQNTPQLFAHGFAIFARSIAPSGAPLTSAVRPKNTMRSIPGPVVALVQSASEGAGVECPLWHSESEEAREEGMYQLAFELDVVDRETFLPSLPAGYAAVHWIFTWEQSRAGEGFCIGIENSGEVVVENAAVSYARLGMVEEAKALRAMLSQYARTPENYAEVGAAYESIENPYKEDWDRIPRAVKVLCERAEELFYEPA